MLGIAVLLASALGGYAYYRLSGPAIPPFTRSTPTAPLPATAAPLRMTRRAAGCLRDGRKIPESVPDLALPGLDGSPHKLSEWTGRPLLINFWATWCEPCRREIPLLKSLRKRTCGKKT